MNTPKIGILGGSGLYSLDNLTEIEELELNTPFGQPSDKIVLATLNGVRLAFIPRHGRGHHLLPSEIPAQANIWALKSLGITWLLGVSAVGSLRAEYRPGDIVIPDQLIDRTFARKSTFFGEGVVAHVSFGDPFCKNARSAVTKALQENGNTTRNELHQAGSLVCMEGPAFSTRAESMLYRSWNADIIGMTALPEAKLAREAELAYALICLVTDYDCWMEHEESVSSDSVLKVLHANSSKIKGLLPAIIRELDQATPSDEAVLSLDAALMTDPTTLSNRTLERLAPILRRRLRKR